MQEGDEIILRFRIGKSPVPAAVRIRKLLKAAKRQFQLEDLGAQPAEPAEPLSQNGTAPKVIKMINSAKFVGQKQQIPSNGPQTTPHTQE